MLCNFSCTVISINTVKGVDDNTGFAVKTSFAQRFLRVEPVNVKNLHRFGFTQKGHMNFVIKILHQARQS
jgi:hypothetical protein